MSETETETAETEAPTRRGRPRPSATIERDDKVYAAIQAAESGVTREELVVATELPGNEVYLSLYRLRRDAKIVRGRTGGAHKWSVMDAEPAEAVPAE